VLPMKLVSLLRPENSLISELNFLFSGKNSLFRCVGNLDKNPRENKAFSGVGGIQEGQNRENSLYLP
jgi:hypothetical protein